VELEGLDATIFTELSTMTQSGPIELTEARMHLDELLVRVKAGEEIVIADGGNPVAKLGPPDANPRLKAFGMFKGRVWMSPDFDAPMSEEELREWGL
jgi:prevent-host-death family protein